MFILTDGKSYVMRNPMQNGKYLSTTSSAQASEFTYKQARSLINSKKAALKWIKTYYMLNKETGKIENDVPKYSNEGVYIGDKLIVIDENIPKNVIEESQNILGLAGWDINQLNTYKNILDRQLSYYDSALSDIGHAVLDKRPPADIRTRIYGLEKQLREKRRDVKQAIKYIRVMIEAINQKWEIGKLKYEMSKIMYVDYKGRTEYFDIVIDMLG